MKHLTIKYMVPEPYNNGFDINELIKWVTIVAGAAGAVWKWVDSKFKVKQLELEQAKLDREEFIAKVAKTAVEAALNSVLTDVKEDIQTLFKYREDDRKHIDKKFDTIMVEMRK